MKTYVIDVRYYISAENGGELDKILKSIGIKDSEYYGGYDIVDIEEDD